jgi:hypothetical protein
MTESRRVEACRATPKFRDKAGISAGLIALSAQMAPGDTTVGSRPCRWILVDLCSCYVQGSVNLGTALVVTPITAFRALALVTPESGEADRCPQLQELCALLLGNSDGLAIRVSPD